MRLDALIHDPFKNKPNIKEASALCRALGVPLAPNCLHYWSNLATVAEVELLRKWLASCDVTEADDVGCRITGAAGNDVVTALRKAFIPHKYLEGKVTIQGQDAASFAFTLGYGSPG
jgi:hypothetical protein